MFAKRLFALSGFTIRRFGLSPDELFFRDNIVQTFQRARMACQVAVGKVQQLFERVEIYLVVDHQRRHNAESRFAFERFVNIFEIRFHANFSFRSTTK